MKLSAAGSCSVHTSLLASRVTRTVTVQWMRALPLLAGEGRSINGSLHVRKCHKRHRMRCKICLQDLGYAPSIRLQLVALGLYMYKNNCFNWWFIFSFTYLISLTDSYHHKYLLIVTMLQISLRLNLHILHDQYTLNVSILSTICVDRLYSA